MNFHSVLRVTEALATSASSLQRNAKNLDDVDPNSESHIYDAIRYALQADRSPHVRFRRVVW